MSWWRATVWNVTNTACSGGGCFCVVDLMCVCTYVHDKDKSEGQPLKALFGPSDDREVLKNQLTSTFCWWLKSGAAARHHVLTSLPVQHSWQLHWCIFKMSQPTLLLRHLLLLSTASMNLCWSCGATLASDARGPRWYSSQRDLSVARVPESRVYVDGRFDLSNGLQGSVTRLWGSCLKSCQTITYPPGLSEDSLIVCQRWQEYLHSWTQVKIWTLV